MGGKTTSTTQNMYPPGSEELMRQRTGVASSLTPDISRLLKGVLGSGSDIEAAVSPYVRTASAPYAAATKQAVDQILRSTPAGGRQYAMLTDAYTKGALQRAQDVGNARNDWMKTLMQMVMGIYGQPIQPTGSTSTQTRPTSWNIGLGPISASF